MLPEPKKVSGEIPEESLGTLSGCLVDGDAEQRSRERSIRRRSLAISIFLQSTVLAALVLVPLFGKAERISLTIVTPVVPYGHASGHQRNEIKRTTGKPIDHGLRPVFPSPTARPVREFSDDANAIETQDLGPIGNPSNDGPPCSGCVDIGGKTSGPQPPRVETPTGPRVVKMTQLDPAMLIHRVEPIYPALGKQMRRDGHVELRAIIGTDGSIQSLQIVLSDPIFNQSAIEAVRQWRYRATVLNGQPVEIDTFITVLYNMQH